MHAFNRPFYGLNLPSFEKQITTSYLKKAELSVKEVENGIILPLRKTELPATDGIYEGGVCDEKFNFLYGYQRHTNGKPNNFEIIRAYQPKEKLVESEEEVIFGGIAFSHFGHFLIETFNRMWWVVKNNAFDKKVVFLKNNKFDSGFLVLLEELGFKKENILFLDKPTKFKKIYVPDQALCYFSHYHEEYILPYQHLMNKIKPSEYKKIYLSRTQFRKRDCINEEYFEQFYQERGYKIVYPEQHSIQEQIALISGADEIVCTIGTISHLALFAQKHARLVILLRNRSYLNVPQLIVNQAKSLNAAIVDVTCNFLPSRYSENCYYIGPNEIWKSFVENEYNEKLDINLIDYLNSDKSRMGDYFNLWLKKFSTEKAFKKVRNDNAFNVLENLEVIFHQDAESFATTAKKLKENLSDNKSLRKAIEGKLFNFSRYDGSHSRIICLATDGTIQNINSKGNDNECYWCFENEQLIFKDKNHTKTSTYFQLSIGDKCEGIGYYERDKKVIFRLEEIIIETK